MHNHWARSYSLPSGNGLPGNVFQAVAVLLSMVLISSTAVASSLRMVADNASDELRVFDVESGAIVASLKGATSRVSGDCALSSDQATGFSSHANQHTPIVDVAVNTALARTAPADAVP